MATYGDLKTRIAREIHRSDLTTDIAAHVLSAVEFYSSNRFYGNETQWTLTTINGTNYYGTTTPAPGTLSANICEIDSITLSVGTRKYQLDRRSFNEIEDIDAGTTLLTGYPREWAWFQGQIRLYPTPNAAYTLTISGQQTLTALSSDSDSNFWTNDAEALIRARTKKTLALDVTEDEGLATRSAAREREELSNLRTQSNKLIASGRLRPTRF